MATLRQLLRIGLPIMLVGFLFSLLTTVDRLIILWLLGTRELGLYSPALSVFGALMIVPGLVSNIMYPRIGHAYGASGNLKPLLPMVNRMIRWNYLAMLPVAVMSGLAFYFLVVPWLLPDYEDARIPLLVVLSSALFLPLGLSLGDLFNVIGRQRSYLSNIAVGMLVNAVASYLFVIVGGLALSGVALGTASGMAAFSALQWMTFRRVCFAA